MGSVPRNPAHDRRHLMSNRFAEFIRTAGGRGGNSEFERWLDEQGEKLHFKWRRRVDRGRVYELSGQICGLLYVLSQPGGWWGPYDGVIQRMNATRLNWLVFLLRGSVEAGYVFARSDVDEHIKRGSWVPNAHGAHQVRASAERTLTPGSEFRSRDGLARLLAARLRVSGT